MNVWVVGQVASPGVQHAYHPDLAADPAWILGELLSRRRGRFEEQIVEQVLVRTNNLIEGSRQREGQQEIGYG